MKDLWLYGELRSSQYLEFAAVGVRLSISQARRNEASASWMPGEVDVISFQPLKHYYAQNMHLIQQVIFSIQSLGEQHLWNRRCLTVFGDWTGELAPSCAMIFCHLRKHSILEHF